MYRPILALIILILCGCAATPYQAADKQGYGYQQEQLAAGLYDVRFIGNTATSPQQVRDMALLRAAEMGSILGYAYLTVANEDSSNVTLAARSGPTAPNLPSTAPSARGYTMGRGMGMSGTNADAGVTSGYTINTSSSGGESARACVLRVRFYKQADADRDAAAQEIAPLLSKLRGEYGFSAAGH